MSYYLSNLAIISKKMEDLKFSLYDSPKTNENNLMHIKKALKEGLDLIVELCDKFLRPEYYLEGCIRSTSGIFQRHGIFEYFRHNKIAPITKSQFSNKITLADSLKYL